MAGRLSQLKTTVASKLTNGSDDDERVDQLEARQERARIEARKEARKEARREKVKQAREAAREDARQEAFEDDSGGILDRALDALEGADPGGQGQQSRPNDAGMMGMGGDPGMADPFGGDQGDPFGDPFGGDAGGSGGGGRDPAGGMADPWAGDAGDEEDVLESMGFDVDDDDGWY